MFEVPCQWNLKQSSTRLFMHRFNYAEKNFIIPPVGFKVNKLIMKILISKEKSLLFFKKILRCPTTFDSLWCSERCYEERSDKYSMIRWDVLLGTVLRSSSKISKITVYLEMPTSRTMTARRSIGRFNRFCLEFSNSYG